MPGYPKRLNEQRKKFAGEIKVRSGLNNETDPEKIHEGIGRLSDEELSQAYLSAGYKNRGSRNNAKKAKDLLHCSNVQIALESMPLRELLDGYEPEQSSAIGVSSEERTEDYESIGHPLSSRRQEVACLWYLITRNKKEACRRAGYPHSNEASLAVAASTLFGKPHVRHRMAELEAEQGRRLRIGADDVVRQITGIAFASITDYLRVKDGDVEIFDSDNWKKKHPVKSFKVTKTYRGKNVTEVQSEFTLEGRLPALRTLLDHFSGDLDKAFQILDSYGIEAEKTPLGWVLYDMQASSYSLSDTVEQLREVGHRIIENPDGSYTITPAEEEVEEVD